MKITNGVIAVNLLSQLGRPMIDSIAKQVGVKNPHYSNKRDLMERILSTCDVELNVKLKNAYAVEAPEVTTLSKLKGLAQAARTAKSCRSLGEYEKLVGEILSILDDED